MVQAVIGLRPFWRYYGAKWRIELERGLEWRVVALTRQQVEDCADVAAMRGMIEREVAQALADRSATA